jgi:hypothetical protein
MAINNGFAYVDTMDISTLLLTKDTYELKSTVITHFIEDVEYNFIEYLMTDTFEVRLSFVRDGEKCTYKKEFAVDYLFSQPPQYAQEYLAHLACEHLDMPLSCVDAMLEYATVYSSKAGKNGPGVSSASKRLPGVTKYIVDCPRPFYGPHKENPGVICDKKSLYGQIIHLNDKHQWSREQIADWLEMIARRDGLNLSF